MKYPKESFKTNISDKKSTVSSKQIKKFFEEAAKDMG
jgi:hypothetical protein